MLENLKLQVYKASLKLLEQGLVIYTWGNVSAIDRKTGLVVIKPSGISYDEMVPGDMVVVDLKGNIIS
ncbi:MAG TPA: class II aldolase/adducin family protein, partial [Prolixibacteraceae bacterium]|nr:class II aldolase/adducin family protein [Prolixibacteraceae bacterium]